MSDQMMKKKLFTIFNEDGTTMESEEQKQYLLLLRFVDDCREKTYEIITDYNNLIDYFIENIDEIDFFKSVIYQSHDRADSPTKLNMFILDCLNRGQVPNNYAVALSNAIDESNITETEIHPNRYNFGSSSELKPIYDGNDNDANDI